MRDYSQHGEQAAILAHFAGRTDGRFLEIGAWDPICFSNTRALYEAGWKGVQIEPSPGPVLNLLAEYGNEARVNVMAAAVSLEPAYLRMRVSDDGVSSDDTSHTNKWQAAGSKFHGELLVPTVTLDQIALWFGGFDFISIDTEGTSVDLFLRMLALEWRPGCICVEHDGRTVEAIGAAMAAGYTVALLNACNLVVTR